MGKAKQLCLGVVWFLILVLVVWWIGLICGILHCLFSPCAACCSCARKGTDFFMRGIKLPYLVSTFMVEGKTFKKAILACVCGGAS